MQKGDFSPLADEEILREIQLLIENLNVRETKLASDHILNLLEELEGILPEDKPKLLSVIQRFFELSACDRLIYRLGRRSGALRKISDLEDTETYLRLKSVVDHYEKQGSNIDEDLIKLMNKYI
jgi:histidyl-tRNA synthetase